MYLSIRTPNARMVWVHHMAQTIGRLREHSKEVNIAGRLQHPNRSGFFLVLSRELAVLQMRRPQTMAESESLPPVLWEPVEEAAAGCFWREVFTWQPESLSNPRRLPRHISLPKSWTSNDLRSLDVL